MHLAVKPKLKSVVLSSGDFKWNDLSFGEVECDLSFLNSRMGGLNLKPENLFETYPLTEPEFQFWSAK